MYESLANRIIDVARKHATPPPYGVVNDFTPYVPDLLDASDTDLQAVLRRNEGKGFQLRFGWRNLKEYFEVGGGWGPKEWLNTGYLEGVMFKGQKIPQPGQPGVDWCGVFAAYCWVKGGVSTAKWKFPGVGGPDVVKVGGNKGISVGDIAILDGPLYHHFLVTAINGPADKGSTSVDAINGNSDYQGITTKKNMAKIDDIKAYLTVPNKMFIDVLGDMYGN